MFVFRSLHDSDHPFTNIPFKLIYDKHLSLTAKGLMAYILSKPPSYHITISDLVSSHANGIVSIRSALKELISSGYLIDTDIFNN